MHKRWFFASLLSVLVVMFTGWAEQVQCQDKYPIKPIDIIVPFSAGGGADLSARIPATYLNKKWGVPVNVVNKPGGNSIPGTMEVYNARPDGYTLLGDCSSSCSQLVLHLKNLPFKIMDRTFITSTSVTPIIFIVPSKSPFKSLKDVADEAKKNPEDFTWTSLGGASGQDIAIRQFLKSIGVDVLKTKPVMSRGGSEAVVLTAGGNVKLGGGTTSASLPAIRAGTVVPVAITEKWSGLPDVPTAADLGYPTVNNKSWYGISGPPGLPSYVIAQWEKTYEEMLKDPEILSRLQNVGAIPLYLNSHSTREYMMKELEELKELLDIK